MEFIIEYYNKYKKYFYIGISSFILFIIMIIIGFNSNNNKVYASIDEVDDTIVLEDEVIDVDNKEFIAIDIKGMVNKPGLYRLETGSVVFDAISAAGGLLDNADTSVINLSKRLEDEMVIIVYSKDEIDRIKLEDAYLELKQSDIDQYLKDTYDDLVRNSLKVFVESNVVFDESIYDDNSTDDEIEEEEIKLININTALLDELVLIPYIGTEKANDIIEYRDEYGNFETIEDIMNVSGIGQATFDKLKDSICV